MCTQFVQLQLYKRAQCNMLDTSTLITVVHSHQSSTYSQILPAVFSLLSQMQLPAESTADADALISIEYVHFS